MGYNIVTIMQAINQISSNSGPNAKFSRPHHVYIYTREYKIISDKKGQMRKK